MDVVRKHENSVEALLTQCDLSLIYSAILETLEALDERDCGIRTGFEIEEFEQFAEGVSKLIDELKGGPA